MITTFITKNKDGNKVEVKAVTQQYVVGLYVAWYFKGKQMPMQSSSDLKELEYHKHLRKEIVQNKDTFIEKESSVIA